MKLKLICLCSAIVLMSLVEIFGPEPNTECKHYNRTSCSVYGCGCGYCLDCGKYFPPETTTINWGYGDTPWQLPPEPSNPLDFIPTWPEYIELPKTLLIEYEYDTGLLEYAGPGDELFVQGDDDYSVRTKKVMGKVEYQFPKGTRLYFKEDE